MKLKKLEICVIDNGSSLLLNRTLKSLEDQTEAFFSYRILDCSAFWSPNRNKVCPDSDYVLFIYSGSCLDVNMVSVIRDTIQYTAAPWLYFDERTYNSEINGDTYGVLEKPDFDPMGFAQGIYTGEGVIFSQTTLSAMFLRYKGNNFAVAVAEMTIAAALQADGIHIRKCLMTRHDRRPYTSDEKKLLLDSLSLFIKARNLGCMEIEQNRSLGLRLFPAKNMPLKLSIIVLSAQSNKTRLLSCSRNKNIEILYLTEDMPYWEKCLMGARKAQNDILCFLDACCLEPSEEDLHTMLNYASLPCVGIVSPCVNYQNSIIYSGVFDCAGHTFTLEKSKEMFQQMNPDLQKTRQTSFPSWLCWMSHKDILFQLNLTENKADKSLSRTDVMLEWAFQTRAKGKLNLYLGDVIIQCVRPPADNIPTAFCEMLFRRKGAYFLDPFCPTAFRCWMRQNTLKGVEAYFPEKQTDPSAEGIRKVFVLSHELSLTGAPVVLSHAVRILKEANWYVVVASPTDGMLKTEFLRQDIPVLILGDMEKNTDWLRLVSDFDLILINTAVPFQQVELLSGRNIPVMWWLHDAKSSYEDYLQYVLPETVSENIHIFTVSRYADNALKYYRPKYNTQQLVYGLKDESAGISAEALPVQLADEKKLFVSVGSIIERKGQDILVRAIRYLPDSVRKQCIFLFVGKGIDLHIFQEILELQSDFPDDIKYVEVIPHDEIFPLFQYADAVICSSRDDPLPTFMAETMMMSGVCICSENTGMSSVIHNGVNGYIYENDDPEELAKCICYVVHPEGEDSLRKASRKTFEEIFTMDVFRKNLLTYIAQCITPERM